ncbi:hypothetical protein ACMD2_22633 [Ananas comosus]|uniref:Uncharacterized protein n=1 Tax=Ananas comosus TaxID=4615 RepID=A0A199VLJ5_ANACO|nr:hypothetical protein ACMD2_22633 [Ananas comosus]
MKFTVVYDISNQRIGFGAKGPQNPNPRNISTASFDEKPYLEPSHLSSCLESHASFQKRDIRLEVCGMRRIPWMELGWIQNFNRALRGYEKPSKVPKGNSFACFEMGSCSLDLRSDIIPLRLSSNRRRSRGCPVPVAIGARVEL